MLGPVYLEALNDPLPQEDRGNVMGTLCFVEEKRRPVEEAAGPPKQVFRKTTKALVRGIGLGHSRGESASTDSTAAS